MTVHYPSLLQLNTRVLLTDLALQRGRPTKLDDIDDSFLARVRDLGFDWLWALSVWQTGSASQLVSRTHPDWRKEFEDTLPDLRQEDILGSGFAVADYRAHAALGGATALARLRQRMSSFGLKLMLDFVPNHTGLDHRWIDEHPEFYIEGNEGDLSQAPQNYVRVPRSQGEQIFAYGRDPYFAGWPDTLQLNYANPATQEAMIAELLRIAGQCDGVRCDMAMLVLPEIFQRTWGLATEPFWPKAIARVRQRYPDFCFLAEVYWDLEWVLQQQGFDFTYDKRLYDRLQERHVRPIRDHLRAGLDYQDKLARFLENHDEPRAAATFSLNTHQAAAVVTYLSPGMRFFHQGQFEGRKKRISPHLGRGPQEPIDAALQGFYERLLKIVALPVVRTGRWQLCPCERSWPGNWSAECILVFAWDNESGERLLVVVNYAANPSQGYARLPFADLAGKKWRLRDLLGSEVYDRDGSELQGRGLYLDVGAWYAAAFWVTLID